MSRLGGRGGTGHTAGPGGELGAEPEGEPGAGPGGEPGAGPGEEPGAGPEGDPGGLRETGAFLVCFCLKSAAASPLTWCAFRPASLFYKNGQQSSPVLSPHSRSLPSVGCGNGVSEVFSDGLEVDSTSKCRSPFVLTEQEEPSGNIMHRLESDFF